MNTMTKPANVTIQITKGFTSKKISNAADVSLTNTTLTHGNCYTEVNFPANAWESSSNMVITGCRNRKK